jgi:hypothetical protein
MKMKTIAIYIVRYKETDLLYDAIRSIDMDKYENVKVTVINNYDILVLPTEFNKVTVLNNVTRPDFSTGHLSRNWNEAIINGFKNLDKPDCDYLICMQADAKLSPKWINFINIMEDKKLLYVVCGRGDEIQVFTPEGIKKVGLYDERFCNIGYQEADYFLRTRIKLPNDCCIVDYKHGRVYNKHNIDPNDLCVKSDGLYNTDHRASQVYHNVSRNWFKKKWNNQDNYMENWSSRNIDNFIFTSKEYVLYPYFENKIDKDVYTYTD